MMRKQYILTESEIRQAIDRMYELRKISLSCRDAGDTEANREFYLMAKGFEEALRMLGAIQ